MCAPWEVRESRRTFPPAGHTRAALSECVGSHGPRSLPFASWRFLVFDEGLQRRCAMVARLLRLCVCVCSSSRIKTKWRLRRSCSLPLSLASRELSESRAARSPASRHTARRYSPKSPPPLSGALPSVARPCSALYATTPRTAAASMAAAGGGSEEVEGDDGPGGRSAAASPIAATPPTSGKAV